MKITRASDYAIRLLTHLARSGEGGTAIALGQKLDIPFNHLSKLIQILGRRGFIATRKGRGGGFSLARRPENIDLSEVIEAIEGPLVVSECILNSSACRFSAKCRARRALSKLKAGMSKMLGAVSISDVAA